MAAASSGSELSKTGPRPCMASASSSPGEVGDASVSWGQLLVHAACTLNSLLQLVHAQLAMCVSSPTIQDLTAATGSCSYLTRLRLTALQSPDSTHWEQGA